MAIHYVYTFTSWLYQSSALQIVYGLVCISSAANIAYARGLVFNNKAYDFRTAKIWIIFTVYNGKIEAERI